jgi:prepilin-type N-terminal cleavage/methylation domain-containing protein
MTKQPKRVGGFTLVELMTVLAIISILVAIAVPSLRSTADVEATCRNMSSLIGEAARTAVSRGPVPPEVAAATNSPFRVRVSIVGSSPHTMLVDLQYEQADVNGNHWYNLQRTTLPRGIQVWGSVPYADLNGITSGGAVGSGSGSGSGTGSGSQAGSGVGTGSQGSAGVDFGSAFSTDVTFGCMASGECEARTIYVGRTDNFVYERYRIVILPLSTSPQVLKGW